MTRRNHCLAGIMFKMLDCVTFKKGVPVFIGASWMQCFKILVELFDDKRDWYIRLSGDVKRTLLLVLKRKKK